jgi:hypothetical protein
MSDPRTANPILVLVEQEGVEGSYLLQWHDKWRAFMFPVTGQQELRDDTWGMTLKEEVIESAGRAVAEATGLVVRRDGLTGMTEVRTTQTSHSGGQVTGYTLRVFKYLIQADEIIAPPTPVVWLTFEQVVDPNLIPISPVARSAVARMLEMQLGG